jgi:hypothetical protein
MYSFVRWPLSVEVRSRPLFVRASPCVPSGLLILQKIQSQLPKIMQIIILFVYELLQPLPFRPLADA